MYVTKVIQFILLLIYFLILIFIYIIYFDLPVCFPLFLLFIFLNFLHNRDRVCGLMDYHG